MDPMDVERHYDGLGVPTRYERAKGPAAGLKKAHNSFKEELIRDYVSGACFVVDVGCGRGGDIGKWQRAGVRNVLGFDISEAQIREAERRASESGAYSYSFETCSASMSELDDVPDNCADAVTAMFSLNYFFDSEERAIGLFETVSRMLKPGGRFVGVYADGDRVAELVKKGPLICSAYSLEIGMERDEFFQTSIGAPYSLALKDTVLDGGEKSSPVEYAVYGDVMDDVASKCGLKRVAGGFRSACSKSVRDSEYKRISQLTKSFVFEKRAR